MAEAGTRLTSRLSARLVTLSLSLAAVWLTPAPAHATKGEPEQLIPDSLPINAERLWLGIRPSESGAFFVGRAGNVQTTPPDWGAQSRIYNDPPRRRAAFDFPSVTRPVRLEPAGGSELMPDGAAGSSPAGMTISVWYKETWNYDGTGIFPIWALGKKGAPESWRMALVLKNGVPVVSLMHRDFELFDAQSVPHETQSPRVDDGAWHHLVLRITRESCTPGRCPSVVDVGWPAQPARFSLYVDGQWRGDEVALAPLGLSRLLLGELPTTKIYDQLNFRRDPSRLESLAFIDDVLLFDAPLSDFEIVKLHEWTSVGYMAQYPLAPKDTLLVGSPGRAELPVQVGAASVPPSDLVAVREDAGILDVREPGDFRDGTTTFAWLRADSYLPGTAYTFYAGRVNIWIEHAAAGFRATCSTNGTTFTGAYARDPRNRFHLVALTRFGADTILYQDGVKVLSFACPDPAGWSQGNIGFSMLGKPDRWLAWTGSFDSVLTANQIDRRAASGPRLWNGTAPGATALADLTGRNALSLETDNTTDTVLGGLYTNDGRNAAQGGIAVDRPAGVFAKADGTLGPGDGSAPFTVSFIVSDKTPEPTGDALYERYAPFRRTLARRVYVDRSFLFATYHTNFSVTHQCVYVNPANIFSRSCVLDIVVGVGPGKAGRRFHVDYGGGFGAGPTHVAIAYGEPRIIPPSPWAPSDPAITRLEPLVVIDGRMINQKNQGDFNRVVDQGEVPALAASTASMDTRWVFGPAFDGSLARMSAALSVLPPDPDPVKNILNVAKRDPAAAAWVLELTDLRVYGHVHRDIEALGLDRSARCAEAGRAVIAGTGPFHGNYCGECAGPNFLVAGATVATRECRPQFTYGDECATTAECEGGAACWKGSCLTTSQAICDDECGQLGRTCVAEGASKRCGGCKAGLARNVGNQASADSWELACSWQPTKKGGEVCGADGECLSGWCLPAASGTLQSKVLRGQGEVTGSKRDSCNVGAWSYNITCEQKLQTFAPTLAAVPWSTPRRCAYEESIGGEICRKLRTAQRVDSKTALDGSPLTGAPCVDRPDKPCPARVKGVQCLDGPEGQCLPGFTKRFRLLDPQACRTALTLATQYVDGTCDVNCVNSKTNHTIVASSDRRNAMWLASYDFGLNTLKRAILGETQAYTLNDRARLIEAGVGPLMIEFAAADRAKKEQMINQYGDFWPLRSCAADFPDAPWGSGRIEAYESQNVQVCEPILLPNGATCPPAGTEGTGVQPWEFCKSSFCDVRGTGTCQDGGKQRQEAEGDGGNKKREGKEAVKFGVVRVDDTRVEVVKDPASDMSENKAGYTANLSQVHVPCVLGTKFPPVDLLNISAFIDKSKPTCSDSKFDLQVMGFTLNPPPPKPLAGSCTLVEASASGSTVCITGPGCDSPTFENLKDTLSWASLLPTFEYCLPLGQTGRKLPKKTKTFLAGPVPITISIGLTLDPCITATFGFADAGGVRDSSQQGLPQLEITPSLGIGVEAKAGVGAEEDNPVPAPAPGGAAAAAAAKAVGGKAGGGDTIGASVGVKLALTIVELKFPIRWGLSLADVLKNGAKVAGLFKLEMFSSISLGLEFLGGWMGIYVTLSVGVFGIDWTLKLFGWTGISLQATLASAAFPLYTIDFRAELAAALAGQQVPPKAACEGNQCER